MAFVLSGQLLCLSGENAPPAADDRSEITRTSNWRCYLHPRNGGLIWHLSSCPSLSVGDSIQDELIDVARSGPPMAHYHTDVIYLCSPILSGSVGAFLDQLNSRRQQKRAAPQTARCLQYQLAQTINSQTIFQYCPGKWAISCWWHVGVPSLLLVKLATFFSATCFQLNSIQLAFLFRQRFEQIKAWNVILLTCTLKDQEVNLKLLHAGWDRREVNVCVLKRQIYHDAL